MSTETEPEPAFRFKIEGDGILPGGQVACDAPVTGPIAVVYRAQGTAPVLTLVTSDGTIELAANAQSRPLDYDGGFRQDALPPWPTTPRAKYTAESERRAGSGDVAFGDALVLNDAPRIASPTLGERTYRSASLISAAWGAHSGFTPGTVVEVLLTAWVPR